MTEDTLAPDSANYKYQLGVELEYLRSEVRKYTGGLEVSNLMALETASEIIRQSRERQITSHESNLLVDNSNKELEIFKCDLKGYCQAVNIKPPDENASLTEVMGLVLEILGIYYIKHKQIEREIQQIQVNLQVLAESESHCTKNNWHLSKDGIIQALTLRLCGESRDRLRRLHEDGHTIQFRPDEF